MSDPLDNAVFDRHQYNAPLIRRLHETESGAGLVLGAIGPVETARDLLLVRPLGFTPRRRRVIVLER